MDMLALKLCDIQGRLFGLSGKAGYSSEEFIRKFMNSEVARGLDSSYNRYQWAGEEYLLEELEDCFRFSSKGNIYPNEVLYWTGYIYRFWHYCKGTESREIVKTAPPETMRRNFLLFHTMDPELAIEDLLEIKNQAEQEKQAVAE